MTDSRFYYFGYGSNLLKERIQKNDPTALFVGIGYLPNNKVNFYRYPTREGTWHGATATIDQTENSTVWGTVWSLSSENMKSVDAQEGVPQWYKPTEIEITLAADNKKLLCRMYRICSESKGLPSPYYLDVIIRGAIQSQLPKDYIDQLRQLSHNGFTGQCDVYHNLLAKLDESQRNKVQVECLKTS